MATIHQFADPRDPSVIPPLPSHADVIRTFRKHLAASEQIKALGDMLAHVHTLYEGWPDFRDTPRLYRRAAELAVRYCSEETRNSAESTMFATASRRFPDLLHNLTSCDVTARDRDGLLRNFVRECLSSYLQRLIYDTDPLTQEPLAPLLLPGETL